MVAGIGAAGADARRTAGRMPALRIPATKSWRASLKPTALIPCPSAAPLPSRTPYPAITFVIPENLVRQQLFAPFGFIIERPSICGESSMRSRVGKLSAFLLCLIFACAVPRLLANKKQKTETGSDDQKRAVHALNRLTFGPRPGDVQKVMAVGVDRWIDEQLHPEKISDSGMEARLAPLRTLKMSSKELMEEFPDQMMIKQVMDGKKSMPSDPARRAIYQVQVARLEQKQERKGDRKEMAPAPAHPAQPDQTQAQPEASEGAKTAEELAAASPDAQSADGNTMNSMSSSNETS